MRLLGWAQDGALYLIIAASLIAGFAAAFGRELEANRRPDRGWWVRRLLIMPMLAISAAAASELFGLTTSIAAFTTAMLSLGGYDALCLLEARWKNRMEAISLARGSGGRRNGNQENTSSSGGADGAGRP